MKKPSPPPITDWREPNIGRVHPGSYLITGLPRIRSAWLAALLTRDDFVCYHEAPTMNMPAINPGFQFGLCDPGAACLYPNAAMNKFGACKIVIIERPPADSRRALEKFAGQPMPNWDAVEARYNYFRRMVADPMIVPFKKLSKYETVDHLHRYLFGGPLNRAKFEVFDGLRIEQDVVKRAQAEAARPAIAS